MDNDETIGSEKIKDVAPRNHGSRNDWDLPDGKGPR